MKVFIKRWWYLLLLVPLMAGLLRVRFDVEVLNLLPDTVQEVHGLKLYQEFFTDSRQLLITVRGEDPDAADSAIRLIAARLREKTNLVADVTWQPPWLDHPEEMAELVACLWLNQPPETFLDLTNRLGPANLNRALTDARDQLTTSLSPVALSRLGYDPFRLTDPLAGNPSGGSGVGNRQDWFSSPDGRLRVAFVEASNGVGDYRAATAWLQAVRSEVRDCQSRADWPPSVTVRYTGAPAFISEIALGMEEDLKRSIALSLVLVAGLFWWAHRSWRPLLWLSASLGLLLLATLASGGWVLGEVNAVSLGFAAILLGLAVDYAMVLYQEAAAAPALTAVEIRRLVAPSIHWSAITTASAFGLLTLAGLPGLAQLGIFVSIGILLAAVIMPYGFLPIVLRRRRPQVLASAKPGSPAPAARIPFETLGITLTATLIALGIVLWKGWQVDHSTTPLQPRHCPAQIAFDELDQEMNCRQQPLLLVMAGTTEQEVALRLDRTESRLRQLKREQRIQSWMLPTGLWPHPSRARTNLQTARTLFAPSTALETAAERAGFTPEATTLAESVMTYWEDRSGSTNALWPTNRSSQWILERAAAWTGDEWLASGVVFANTNADKSFHIGQLHDEDPKVWVTAWPVLAEALLGHVENRLPWLVLAMATLVTGCLWLAFRRWTEVCLSLGTVGFGFLVLLAMMGLIGWSWNLMSLLAIPMLLGAGVDYTIHIQSALRRHKGDIQTVRRITGKAVFVCAATTAFGFGSNAFSSNSGLASLGAVCAVGIVSVYLSAVFLLPAWWVFFTRAQIRKDTADHPPPTNQPSTVYRARVWRAGHWVVTRFPLGFLNWFGRLAGHTYCLVHPDRRATVERNLLPVFSGNVAEARLATRRLYANFGFKMVQLLRCEAGRADKSARTEWHGWDHLSTARATGQGVILITAHLGNWELGGYFLAQQGVNLLVLTQPEPGVGLTELRQESRSRWGIETLVIGRDPFAFIEVIKRLQAGAVIALLVDRPPPSTAVAVRLFGHPFHASNAAAELARATGCEVLPVYVVHHQEGMEARILPRVAYDRQELKNREARKRMTQTIISVLEPVIRQHVEQWYHFVPIWPTKEP